MAKKTTTLVLAEEKWIDALISTIPSPTSPIILRSLSMRIQRDFYQ